MSLFSHATHVYLPDQDTGRVIASAMLRSEHAVLISKPYGKWINAYLPMGLSYKDVKEFPTATALEMNCFEDEGFEIKFFTSDRLAFHFESGMGDIAEQEDELLEIAAEIWEQENPEQAARIKALHESATLTDNDSADEDAPPTFERIDDFWSLSVEEQKPFLQKAKSSEKFKKYNLDAHSDQNKIDVSSISPFLPEGKSLGELEQLIEISTNRFDGPPENDSQKELIAKYMVGKHHSDNAGDYLLAFQNFFEVKGSLWSLESLQDNHSDQIDRRIVSLDKLPNPL